MLSYVFEFEANELQITNDETVIPSGDNMYENMWEKSSQQQVKNVEFETKRCGKNIFYVRQSSIHPQGHCDF